MHDTYDVIIIGGGVNGGSIAFHLAKRGMNVLVLEKDRVVSKASSAAAGMLGAQVELNGEGPLVELARLSRSRFRDVATELYNLSGVDIEFVDKGMMRLAMTEGEKADYKNVIHTHNKQNEPAEWLSSEDVAVREPAISRNILGAMYLEKDGQVAAPKLAVGFLKSAISLGTVIKEDVEVNSFYFSDGRVIGVATNDGDYMCDNIVVTGGAWSEQLLATTGLSLPLYPVKGECFSVKTKAPLLTSTVFTEGCYLVPKRGGRTLVGATVVPHTFDSRVTFSGLSSLMEKAKRIVPAIEQSEWERAWSGIRPQTADGLPYLGEHPEYKGLFIATGHYRNGILLSPITGEVIADLIEGRAPAVNLSAFRIDRINQPNLIVR